MLSRAFDHICMEKARYKFLIIIIIINLSGYFPGCSFSASLTCEPPKGVKNSIDDFDHFEQSGLMYLSGGSLAPSSLSSLSSKDVNWIELCRSNKAFILALSSRESRALSNTSVRFVNF